MRFWQSMGLVLLLGTSALPVNAINVTATDWQHNLTTPISNAGDYYDTTLTTSTNVSINNTSNNTERWQLNVRLHSAINGLAVSVKRTGQGAENSNTTGGDNYLNINTAFQTLCSGQGDTTNIPL